MQTLIKNEQGSHWGLLPYDDNGRKCESDETNTSLCQIFSKPQGPHLYIYLHFKKMNTLLNVHTRKKQCLSLTYTMSANASNNSPLQSR